MCGCDAVEVLVLDTEGTLVQLVSVRLVLGKAEILRGRLVPACFGGSGRPSEGGMDACFGVLSSAEAKQGVKFSLSRDVVGKCGKLSCSPLVDEDAGNDEEAGDDVDCAGVGGTTASGVVGVVAPPPKLSFAKAVVGDCTEVLSTAGRNKNDLGVAIVGDVGLRSSAMHCRL